ncbi:hypothetical protein JCM8202_002682 [Rhodotorula sphaerocarpa]
MPSYRLLLAGLVSIAGSAEILAAPTTLDVRAVHNCKGWFQCRNMPRPDHSLAMCLDNVCTWECEEGYAAAGRTCNLVPSSSSTTILASTSSSIPHDHHFLPARVSWWRFPSFLAALDGVFFGEHLASSVRNGSAVIQHFLAAENLCCAFELGSAPVLLACLGSRNDLSCREAFCRYFRNFREPDFGIIGILCRDLCAGRIVSCAVIRILFLFRGPSFLFRRAFLGAPVLEPSHVDDFDPAALGRVAAVPTTTTRATTTSLSTTAAPTTTSSTRTTTSSKTPSATTTTTTTTTSSAPSPTVTLIPNAVVDAGVTGFLGDNTNAIISWFHTDSSQDSTNGHSWCGFPYSDAVPGFAPSLNTMLSNFNWDYEAAATAYCGLEAVVTTPDGRTATLYIADAFDDTWVRTPSSIDVVYDSFATLYGSVTTNKNDVVKDGSWYLTGNRNERYKFKGLGAQGL